MGRYNPNKRLVSAGNTGVSVVMNFEAVGTMDGGEVVFTVPSAMDPPQNTNSTVNGYVSVPTTGSPVIGVLSFPTLNSQAVVVPTTTMKKGDTISVTYRVDDADITNVLDSHIFTVKTRLDTAQSFSDGSVIAAARDYELSSSGNTLKLIEKKKKTKKSAKKGKKLKKQVKQEKIEIK